jgi:hypothetical protein
MDLPRSEGHIQATARDARGRKQYRYHARWQEASAATKFERMLAFGEMLPRIRRTVSRALRQPGMPREKVLAAVVQLLDLTLIRVGNDEYARQNRSYGLTTLLTRHVQVDGTRMTFEFRGKSGIAHRIELKHRALAAFMKACLEIPGPSSSSTSTRTDAGTPSLPATSTPTCNRSADRRSAPRISARGAAARSRSATCGPGPSRRRPKRSASRARCSRRSPSGWATRRRCAASRTSIRTSSNRLSARNCRRSRSAASAASGSHESAFLSLLRAAAASGPQLGRYGPRRRKAA